MSFTRKCWFYLVCLFAGLCTGAVGGYFQFFLHKADHLRMELTTWAHSVSFWEGFGAVVIDVGIHRNAENKLCGDVDFDSVVSKASHITPVPGGVGPMTIAMLMSNCVEAMKR